MFGSPERGTYNFRIARDENQNIETFGGVIPLSHFDPNLAVHNDTWPSLWLTISKVPGLGTLTIKESINQYETFGAIGINDKVVKIYTMLKFVICDLKQYYIINNAVSDFKIATIKKRNKGINHKSKRFQLKRIENLIDIDSIVTGKYNPMKSINFMVNRYEKHPYYRYQFYLIEDTCNQLPPALMVIRKIGCNGSSCLRIVDVLGELFPADGLYAQFQILLQRENVEYIDFYNHGIQEEVFYRMGFSLRKENDENIVPNYFEPFISKNINIKAAYYNSKNAPYIIFRGDSDQDRPNIVPGDNFL